MKTYTHNGCYGYGTSYVLETPEDWDEYENILNKNEDWLKYNPNFYSFKKDFEDYIGKQWKKGDNIYKIIALEDDNANYDWYWVVQNIDDDRDIKYELANDSDFYKNII